MKLDRESFEYTKPRIIIFIRSTVIANLMDEVPHVGGIAVQLYFWSQVFAQNGWTVYSLSRDEVREREGVKFLKYNTWGRFEMLHEWFHTAWVYWHYKPDLVMERGAGRTLYSTAKLAKFFRIKTVLFGASDVNFEPGKELISGGLWNRRYYQKGILLVNHIVVQNEHQKETLMANYGRDSLILPNIWGKVQTSGKAIKSDVVWVANLRPLKRPEWILKAAESLPEVHFTMVGDSGSSDRSYYEKIKEISSNYENVTFLGGRPFLKTCDIVSQSKILVCTSEFEGFPNTFLQAWSYGLPVVSTVDPSGIIANNGLGEVIKCKEDLVFALKRLLEDKVRYEEMSGNVKRYFMKNYSSADSYRCLMDYIGN